MSLALWIEVVGLYVSRWQTDDRVHAVHRDKVILDACPAAIERGVVPGLPLRSAKTLYPEAVFHEWEEEDYVGLSHRWLDLCVPFTGGIDPIDQHQAYLDLSLHPDPIDIADRIVRRIVHETKLHVRYGLSPCPWVARVAADFTTNTTEAYRAPAQFLKPLPLSYLLPVEPTLRQRLTFLGCHTIGDVAELPKETLMDQFGEDGFTIHQAANARFVQPIRSRYPTDLVSETMIFPDPIDDLETIDRIHQKIASRIADRLSERDCQGSILQVHIEQDEKSPKRLSRKFTRPIRCARTALAALRLLTDGQMTSPVLSIRAVVKELERKKRAQAALLDSSSRPPIVESLQYVRTVYGDGSVVLARDVVVPRRVRVLREWRNATGWR